MNSLNKSFSSSHEQNPEQNRLYDHLQQIYNSDAYQNKRQSKMQKQLYFKLIEQNERKKQEKKMFERQVNQQQNQQIDAFWKNKQNQLRQKQRIKKQMIQEARDVNNITHAKRVLSKSMVMPTEYQLSSNNYYGDLIKNEEKIHQLKQFKNKFLQEGQAYNNFKQYQQYMQRQKIVQTQRKTLRQNQEIQGRRLQQLQKWRKKHLQPHNKQAFQIWDKARKSKTNQQDALQNYIVFQGAKQLNQRTSKMKNQIYDRQNAKRQHYIRQLHSQLENNQYRTANDSKTLKQYEKRVIDNRNQILAQKDKLLEQNRKQQHKQHLKVLQSQIKPKSLLPEKQKVQFPGLGSPVHIGKTLADDRRKQLQWLQKNLYRQLSH